LEEKQEDGEVFFLVKWKNYPLEEATLEPFANVYECRGAMFEYFSKFFTYKESERLLAKVKNAKKLQAKRKAAQKKKAAKKGKK
jgi:hypothetical protein